MKEDITKLQTDLKDLQQKYEQLLMKFNMHFHDGNNSQKVNFGDLFPQKYNQIYVSGTVTLVSGTATIINSRINTGSTGFVMSTVDPVGAYTNLYFGIPSAGSYQIDSSQVSDTSLVQYIIFFNN